MFWAPSNKIRLLLVHFQQCNHPTLQIENWQLFHNTRLHIFTFPFFFWSERHQYFSIAPEVFIPVLPVPYLESLLTILSQRQLKQKEGRNVFLFPLHVTQLNLTFSGMDKQSLETTLTISKTATASSSNNNKKNTGSKWHQTCYTHAHTSPHISTLSLLSWTLTVGSTS